MRLFMALTAALVAGLVFPAGAQQPVPVKKVVLSTSGLGYFEHSATINGAGDLNFPVRTEQVNDILKSLLIFDPEGKMTGVSLPGKQPLQQIFRDLPFSQDDLDNPVALLNAYQGAEVDVRHGGESVRGRLVSVTPEVEVADEREITRHRLGLMTDEGLKSFIYENVSSVGFTDESVRNEINRALEAVRANSESGRRWLSIGFDGAGARTVLLSYVVQAPLWKTSYRLVLPAEDETDGHLQGWAVIENMTGGDWQDIKLSLTSGNPVTLQQDLYPAYYTERPFVPIDVFGRVLPRRDDGAVEAAANIAAFSDYGAAQGATMNRRAMAKTAAAAPPMLMESLAMASDAVAGYAEPEIMRLGQSQMIAAGSDAAAQILFEFPVRFDLESGQTMMVPFIDRQLDMEQVALYQPDRQANHPFLSVSVTNESDSSLPPGILTLYRPGENGGPLQFVGDSQLALFPKGEKRMVSYALDQKTRIDTDHHTEQTLGKLASDSGVLKISVQYIDDTVYTIKPPADEARKLVIEHPRRSGYTLDDMPDVDSEAVEMTDTHYRIPVALKAGETQKIRVRLKRTALETLHVSSMSYGDIMAIAASGAALDDNAKELLSALAGIRRAMATMEAEARSLQARKNSIFKDQERLRENIGALSGTSDLKDRYLVQLNSQEDELQAIDEKRVQLEKSIEAKRRALQKAIANADF